ncbi:hypothetical protein CLOM_g3245 [Closterium sp. NIES-68]|nr:hypothetical protein CLOM_g3245 [Closterium sp. NIES-68]GJP59929.1 hypothetical protein CLOP_g16173 [Closterium sp. NIES-67]GJP76395.1 hypothetical protein CLOP_g6846 [Closterium sp. NIES-67]
MTCEVFELKELLLEHYQIREVLRCLLHTIMFHRALGLVRPKSIDSELFDITYVQCGDAEVERQIEEKIGQFSLWLEKNPTKKGQLCLSFFEKRRPITGTATTSSSGSSNTARTKSEGSSQANGSSSSGGGGGGGGSGSGSTRKDSAASWLSASAARLTLGSDKIIWEQWIIPVSLLTSPSGSTPGQPPFSSSSSSSSPSSSPAHTSAAHTAVATTAATSGASSSPSPSFSPSASAEAWQRQQRSAQLEADVREALLSILTMANEKRDHLPPVLTSSLVSFPFEISVPSMSDSFGMDVLKRMLQTAPHHVLG